MFTNNNCHEPSSKLRIALLGCGRIAERHAEILGGFKIEDAILAAVCDLDFAKAKYLGEKYSVPYFTNFQEMLDKVSIDVISILTESGNHAKDVFTLAPYGKHLIVEKPMALSIGDAEKMIELAKQNEIKLFVVKQNRYNLPVLKLKQAINQKRFGRMVLGTVRVRWCRPQSYYDQAPWRGTWSLDGGVLANQASHHIDMLLWMLGDVESLHAFGATSLVDIEAEDTAVVSLKFKNGALGVIEATTATRPRDLEGSISILGEHGVVEIGGFAVNEIKRWDFIENHQDDNLILKNFSVNPPNVYGFGHHEFYSSVVDSILNDKPHMLYGEEGKRSLEIILAIYESIETGKVIKFPHTATHTKLGK